MTNSGRYHGGLVFFGNPDQALDRITRIVTETLEDYGHPIERQSIVDPSQAHVVASQYRVELTLAKAPEPILSRNRRIKQKSGKSQHRLVICLCPVAPGLDVRDISELLLVVMLYRMSDVLSPRSIEWLAPETVLTMGQFFSAFANVSPRRVQGTHGAQAIFDDPDTPFHLVDDTEPGLSMRYDALVGRSAHDGELGLIDLSEEEALALAYRTCPHPDEIDDATIRKQAREQAQRDIRRLATWGMTGMVAFLSAPVALSLAAVNLIRGEDFRLNTHVLSLTGLLVVLQSSGALAGAMSLLPL